MLLAVEICLVSHGNHLKVLGQAKINQQQIVFSLFLSLFSLGGSQLYQYCYCLFLVPSDCTVISRWVGLSARVDMNLSYNVTGRIDA